MERGSWSAKKPRTRATSPASARSPLHHERPHVAIDLESASSRHALADKLDGMAVPVPPAPPHSYVSPVLVGREIEILLLSETLKMACAGSARAILLGGEAGVGKTRLVNEFAARVKGAGRGACRVLVGGCPELSSQGLLPYAPFTAALRQLVRELGADGVAALIPGGNISDLARLLPGLGEIPAHADPDTGRVRLFEQMLTLLERLADQAPLVLLIEDAHWADRSTRDLLSFLVTNVRDERVLLLITFRSDELHRTHPLRSLLADLGRMKIVTRLDLPRLSRSQVAAQLAGILGSTAEPTLVEDVYGRSSGIPLFVEAMADFADKPWHSVPESLRDLLLTAVQKLPEESQDILRVASASDRASHELLAAVTGMDHAELSRALRPAVDAKVLLAEGDGYAFRHALIREAIHEDLLPGEHSRLHRQFAEALEGHPELSHGVSAALSLAQHWQQAHVTERALPAAWRAANEAAAALAFAEQVQMLERVLALWDRVPNAAELVGHPQIEIMEMAAEAAYACGEAERGLAFVRAALAEADEAEDPELVAHLLIVRAKLNSWRRDYLSELEDLRRAERLVPEPTLVRSMVLTTLCSKAMLTASLEECRALGEEAMAIARGLGNWEAQQEAAIVLASAASLDGDGDPTELLDITEKVTHARSDWLLLRCLINLSHFHEGAGEPEQAIAVAARGLELAERSGRVRGKGAFIATNLAESLMSLGRWDDAIEVAQRIMDYNPAPSVRVSLLLFQGRIVLARGDLELSGEAVAAASRAQYDAEAPQNVLPLAETLINWKMAQGDPESALDAVDQVINSALLHLKPRYTWPLLVQAARACADLCTDPGAVNRPEFLGRTTDLLARLREVAGRTPASGPVTAAHAVTFAAESSRGGGLLDRPAWDVAATAWEALRRPYPRAQALYRAAEAAAGDGDREGAAERLRVATHIAQQLQARPLSDRLHDLARRARITTNPGAHSPHHGLTSRELEVLGLLAQGRTNREIADALFIAAKTASVHVSNILAKLGVATRGEAAATAHQLDD
jgi:ATP/maltotriose-dependent transcriptional regulator MalT